MWVSNRQRHQSYASDEGKLLGLAWGAFAREKNSDVARFSIRENPSLFQNLISWLISISYNQDIFSRAMAERLIGLDSPSDLSRSRQ
jgi:hypothetical protein